MHAGNEGDIRRSIRELQEVAVAFSGGVDSTLLLYLAYRELQGSCLAITVDSCLFPERELKEAQAFCREHGIRQIVLKIDPFSVEGFSQNPPERCYLCKKDLLENIREAAIANGFNHIVEGSNLDDESDYRPGRRALQELGILSPLRDAGFTKQDVRDLSRDLGLPTSEKQSFACLASRIPCGDEITLDRLVRIERAEQFLLDEGFSQLRVRSHGDLARIETDEKGMLAFSDAGVRKRVQEALSDFGFRFVALDLGGYKTGSMNYLLKSSPTTTRISP